MVVPPTALSKLRKELRKRRLNIYENTNFASRIKLSDVFEAARSIALYLPMGGEPDPFPLLGDFAGVTSVPALETDGALMTFRRWTVGDALVTSPWGGRQPPKTAATVIPDLIIVPMLCFDANLNRLGQGGGHYDRYLAAYPHACRIGLAWEGQQVDHIDAQPWDVPMDAILTEATFHVKDLTRCQRP